MRIFKEIFAIFFLAGDKSSQIIRSYVNPRRTQGFHYFINSCNAAVVLADLHARHEDVHAPLEGGSLSVSGIVRESFPLPARCLCTPLCTCTLYSTFVCISGRTRGAGEEKRDTEKRRRETVPGTTIITI